MNYEIHLYCHRRGVPLPDEERVHLFQTEFQDLLFELPIDLCRDLQVLLKHLTSEEEERQKVNECQTPTLTHTDKGLIDPSSVQTYDLENQT